MKNSTQPGRLKQATTKQTLKWASGIALMLLTFFNPMGVKAQSTYVPKPFKQRSSIYSPGQTVYHIQGDYQMIGNTNLTQNGTNMSGTGPSTSQSNNTNMMYVDIDGDNNTVNSSRAQLKFSTERGANPECTNVIYAGLYWTGRKSQSTTSDGMSYTVSAGTSTNNNYSNNQTFGNYTLTITTGTPEVTEGDHANDSVATTTNLTQSTWVERDYNILRGYYERRTRTETETRTETKYHFQYRHTPITYTFTPAGGGASIKFDVELIETRVQTQTRTQTRTRTETQTRKNRNNWNASSYEDWSSWSSWGSWSLWSSWSSWGNSDVNVFETGSTGIPTNIQAHISANTVDLETPFALDDHYSVRFFNTGTTKSANVLYSTGSVILNKNQVKFKHADGTYQTITANTNDIYYPSGRLDNIYTAYAEVTDIVKQYGEGDYYVADICCNPGNGGSVGYFGGWGLVVIYENSQMKWRDITVFDGHAYLSGANNPTQQIDLSGFKAVQVGHVNLKLGMMAAEGDVSIDGDYCRIKDVDGDYKYLAHDGTVGSSNAGNYTNFFKSAVNVGGYSRYPNFTNNMGVDITMINLENPDNSIIRNEQTSTSFRFGTRSSSESGSKDTYVPFCLVFGCDAYIPDARVVDAVMESAGAQYDAEQDVWVTTPGQEVTFTMKVHNYDDEDIRDAEIRVPLPVTINYYSVEAEYADGRTGTYYYDPTQGVNGTAVWTLDYLPAGYPDSVWATFKLKCKVTEDCYVLASTDEQCLLRLIVNGTLSGTSVVNGVYFVNEFIQGFQQSGTCQGATITEDLIVVVDREDWVKEHCVGDYTLRELNFCSAGSLTNIPFTEVSQYYPLGTRFYNSSYSQEYTMETGFPSSCWNQTLIAAAPSVGDATCDSKLIVKGITGTSGTHDVATFSSTNVQYCLNATADPMSSLVTDKDADAVVLFYLNDPSLPQHQSEAGRMEYVPSTSAVGTETIYARQYIASDPCYEGTVTPIQVTVVSPLTITHSLETPSCAGTAVTFTPNVIGGTWTIPAEVSDYVTVNPTTSVATISESAPVKKYTLTYTAPESADAQGCPEALSQTFTHEIIANTVGGHIEPATITICQGSDIPTLNLTDYVGHVERWYYKKSTETDWTLIPNNTWRITQADVAELEVGTYQFKAVVKNGVCASEESDLCTVVVSDHVAPASPSLTSPVFACPGAAYEMGPDNSNYRWYATEVGGEADATLRTGTMGTSWQTVYVSTTETSGGITCESHRVLVEARPKFTAGAIQTEGQVACTTGATATTIGSKTAAAPTDGYTGVITYQWYVAKDEAAPVAISGANAATYTPAAEYMNADGKYVFTRKANIAGCTEIESTGSWTLLVGNPDASITVAPSVICGTTPVTLTATGTTLKYRYQWYKDGVEIAGATSNTHATAIPGNYTVKVTHKASECSSTTGTPVNVQKDDQAPVVPANQNTTIEGCSMDVLPAAYTTIEQIETAFSTTISDIVSEKANLTLSSTSETLSETCPFQVRRTYTVTDECGNAKAFTHTITIKNETKPVISVASQNNPAGECNPASIVAPTFTVNDPCNATASATVSAPAATGSCEKTRTWTASYTSACGVAADNMVVTYTWKEDNTAPTIDGVVVPAAVAAGNCKYTIPDLEAATLAATTDAGCDNVTFVSQNPAAGAEYTQTTTAQDITVTVKVQDACGNETTKNLTVVIPAKVSVSIADVEPVCAGENVTLNATVTPAGSYTYAWSNDATTEDITVTAGGNYTITVTGDNGCTATASKDVTVYEAAEVAIAGVDAVLVGQETTLTATAGYENYNWTVDGGTIVSGANTNTIKVKWSDGGNKTVNVTVSNEHCTATATHTVKVNPLPTLTLNCPEETTSNCFNFPTLEATGYASAISVAYTEDPEGCTITLPTLPDGWSASGNDYNKLVQLPSNTPASDVQNFLRNITFCVPANTLKDVSFTLFAEPTANQVYYLEEVDHYYTFVPFETGSTMTWMDCYNAAKEMTYLGRQGYLATLTSLNEDKFVTRLSESVAWIGATRLPGNVSDGQYYASFTTASEAHPATGDKWYWACGPEKDQVLFPIVQASTGGDRAAYYNSMTSAYSNWGGNEPNNGSGGESCLTVLKTGYTGWQNHTPAFAWNDRSYNANIYVTGGEIYDPRGYLVEFGDLEIGNSTADVYATSVKADEKVGNGQEVSTAVISGNATYCKGATTTTNLNLEFSGTAPFNGKVVGTDGTEYTFSNVNSLHHTISVAPTATTTYTISEFGDATTMTCGRTVDYQKTGSAVVTIRDAFNAGVIETAGQTICQGGTLTTIGSATAATGGDNTISYKWQLNGTDIAGATSATYTPEVTAPGTYTFTRKAKDATCSDWTASEGTYTVTIHANPTVTVADETICSGETAELTATTGDVTKIIWKQGGAVKQENTTKTYTTDALTANTTYSIEVIDVNGCTASTTATVTVNALPTVVATATPNAICKGATATLSATGATTYVWSATSPVAPTTTTSYIVTGTDANGCQNIATVTVTVYELPTITKVVTNNPTCNGTANGSITITATEAAQYSIDNGATWQTSNTFNDLAAGTYNVVVKSAHDCESSYYAPVSLTQPSNLAVTVSGADAVCNGSSAALTTTVTGGTAPYSYVWSNTTETTANVNVTPTATTAYGVTVTDAQGCTASSSKTVAVNALPTVTISGNNYICNDGNTTLTADGATSYVWSNSTTEAAVTVNAAGTYTVTGTDANGCKNTASIDVTKKSPAVEMAADQSLTICNGTSTSLTASTTSSEGTVTYEWNTGETTASITTGNLTAAATYTVTATATIDACSVTDEQKFNVAVYDAFNAGTISGNDAICAGSILTSHMTETAATGGNGTITYQWYVDGTAIAGATSETYTPSSTYTNAAGTYVFTRKSKDATCATDMVAATGSYTLTVYPKPTVSITPSNGTVIATTDLPTTITANAAGGTTPYTYNWTSGEVLSATDVAAPQILATTTVGNHCYEVTLKDANNCQATAGVCYTIQQGLIINNKETEICDGSALNYTPVAAAGEVIPAGTMYTWTVNTTSNVEGAAGQSTPAAAITNGALSLTYPNTVGTVVYNVHANNGGGTADFKLTVTVQPKVQPLFAGLTTEYCYAEDELITLPTAEGTGINDNLGTPVTGTWSPASFNKNMTAGMTTSKTFTATFTPAAGVCAKGASKEITVFAPVNGGAISSGVYTTCNTTDTMYTFGNAVSASGGGTGAYSWEVKEGTGEYNTIAGANNDSYTPNYHTLAAGTYTIHRVYTTACATEYANPEVTFTYRGNVDPGMITSSTHGNPSYFCKGTSADISLTAHPSFADITPEPHGQVNWQVSTDGGSSWTNLTSPEYGAADVYDYTYHMTNLQNEIRIQYNFKFTDCDETKAVKSNNIFVIRPNELPQVATVTTPISCPNVEDGYAVSATATGGNTSHEGHVVTPSYSWTWTGATANTTDNSKATVAKITGNDCGHEYTVTATVTDANGCEASKTATFTVQDLVAPAIASTLITTAKANVSNCVYTVPDFESIVRAAATDNCTPNANLEITQTPAAGTVIAANTTVTVTVADACGAGASGAASNKTSKTITVTIPEKVEVTVENTIDITCSGATDGSISISVEKGTPGYSINWGSGNTTLSAAGSYDIENLSAGNYTITVTDADGCSTSISQVVEQSDALLTVTATATNVTCYGANDGVVTYTIADGTADYDVTLSNGSTTVATATKTAAGTYTFTGLAPATYTLEVVDAYGCEKTATATVSQSTAMLAVNDVEATPVTCKGSDNGKISYTIAGGTANYSVTLAGPTTGTATQTAAGTYNFQNLKPGTYTITVEDANGCEKTATTEVKESTALLAITATAEPAYCSTIADGKINYTITNGTPDFTVNLAGAATATATQTAAGTYTFANLANGNYTVTVTDAYGCVKATETVNVATTSENIAVVANSHSWTYDGASHTDNGYTLTVGTTETHTGVSGTPITLANGDVVTFNISGSITNVTESPVSNLVTDAFTITRGAEDVTCHYNVTRTNGTLKVTPSSDLEIMNCAAMTKTQVYNGTALSSTATPSVTTGTTVEYSIDGGTTWTATAPSVTNVTTTPMAVKVRATNANYEPATCDYTLEVTCAPVTVKAATSTFTYDGNVHSDATYTVTGLVGTDAISATITGSIQFVSQSPVTNVVSSYTFTAGDANNYCVTTENGELKMIYGTCQDLLITADSRTWTYDGTTHTQDSYMLRIGAASPIAVGADGVYTFANGDKLTVVVDGSVKNYTATGVANAVTSYTIMNGTQDVSAAYCVTTIDGVLKINKRPVTITADDNSKMYDGTPLTDNGWMDTPPTNIAATDNVASVTVTGTITNAGSVPNVPSNAVIMNGTDDVTENYDITYVNGTLTIEKRTGVVVTVQEHSAEFNFDGTPKTDHGFDIVSIEDPVNIYTAHDFSFAPTSDSIVTKIPVGTYDMTVVPEDFTNLNANYDNVTFVVLDGQLKIYDSLHIVSTTIDAVTCYAANDGKVVIDITGGKPVDPRYSYTLDGGAAATTNSPLTLTGLAAGTHTVIFTDALGYTKTVTFTVEQPELLKVAITTPTALCPNQASYPVSAVATGGNGGYHYVWSDDATDVDAAATTVAQVGANDCGHEYTASVVVTDVKGCTANATANFTVQDNEAPTFTRPADITIYKDATCNYDASVTVTGDVTDEHDNCSTGIEATYTDAEVTPTDACEGTTVIARTWTLVDVCGNAATPQVQTITVIDNIAPTFTAPADITIYKDANCNYNASVAVTGDVTDEADNCSTGLNATFTDVDVTPATACEGMVVIERTWHLVDNCGNAAADQVQTITVEDNTAPTFTAPVDITIYKDAACNYDASVAVTGDVTDEADNCSTGLNATYTDNDVTPATACEGTTVIARRWSLVDDCGNVAPVQVQTITVVDNIAPTFDLPADTTICRNSTTGEIEAPVITTGEPTNHADNCTAVATLVANTTFTDLDTLPAADNADRVIRREWTVTDDCGNAASQIQNITVRPSILTPGNYDFTCPTDVHVVLPYNECDMFVNIGFPEFMNHMIGMDVTISNNAPAGSIFPEGTHIVTWTATDECGASLTCDQLVVVEFPPCGTPSDSTTDANGNRYSSVRIGCQCWTGENLRAENYFNEGCDAAGNAIAVAKSYNNSDSLENVYGKLYSWYSAVGVAENSSATPAVKTTPEGVDYVQGLCPCGWAIPTPEQYQTMVTVSGGADYVKTTDTRFWLPGSEGVDPTALFKARGAGYFNADSDRFEELMGTTGFWTVDNTSGSAVGTTFMITHYCQEGLPTQKLKNYNYSVRCLRME